MSIGILAFSKQCEEMELFRCPDIRHIYSF
ncbi:Uncharacterised protein [Vibrio cholerae]|uniref:Uncharacterized protein n=1 Tax=Vibrio cholerae TaxID=666 RepID=A0A655W5H2_VIBCL|nr:Uncharacterised protein [Vibrio cholerae]CSB25225.1 Uncharacterised protein [Vibrio cholerae]CSB83461.1 Uncharacterised protein [Vibrio cholerae]CSC17623.1 Uncharacterised protein [Vibrio cholerae]CSC90649.1 Uncharacterised protein [Vibrio cholerae]